MSPKQGESFHRSPKAWFKSTSKKQIRKELTRHERKRARLRRARERIHAKERDQAESELNEAKESTQAKGMAPVKGRKPSRKRSANARKLQVQRLAARNPDIHHYIGISKQSPVYLSAFAQRGALSMDIACLVSFISDPTQLSISLRRSDLCPSSQKSSLSSSPLRYKPNPWWRGPRRTQGVS